MHAMVKKQQLGGLITSLFSKEVSRCPSASSASSSSSSSSAWQWASCGQPRTLSFRQEQQQQQVHHGHQLTMPKQAYKTMNSAYSVDYSSFSTASEEESSRLQLVDAFDHEVEAEAVICALRSDRLLFEPADASSSSCVITNKHHSFFSKKEKANLEDDDDHCLPRSQKKQVAFDGATAMSVESQNPYRDFRESMESMVMSHGSVKDWRWLEEMLGWYLQANGKSTHGLIVGAFVDLLVSLTSNSTSPGSSSASDDCSSSSLL